MDKYKSLPIILIYLVFAYTGLNVTNAFSDEYIYYQNALAITKGFMPYRDFFTAHLPHMIYLPAYVFSLLGFDSVYGKMIPLILSTITLLSFTRNQKMIAAVSPIWHMFSFQYFGMMPPVLLVTLALKHKKIRTIFILFACAYRLNFIPYLLYVMIKKIKGHASFIDNTVLFHLNKINKGLAFNYFIKYSKNHIPLLYGLFTSPVKTLVILYMIFTLVQNAFFRHYFIPLYPITGHVPFSVILIGAAMQSGNILEKYEGTDMNQFPVFEGNLLEIGYSPVLNSYKKTMNVGLLFDFNTNMNQYDLDISTNNVIRSEWPDNIFILDEITEKLNDTRTTIEKNYLKKYTLKIGGKETPHSWYVLN